MDSATAWEGRCPRHSRWPVCSLPGWWRRSSLTSIFMTGPDTMMTGRKKISRKNAFHVDLAVEHHGDQQGEYRDDRHLHDGLPDICRQGRREIRILQPDLSEVAGPDEGELSSQRCDPDVKPRIVEGLSQRDQRKRSGPITHGRMNRYPILASLASSIPGFIFTCFSLRGFFITFCSCFLFHYLIAHRLNSDSVG